MYLSISGQHLPGIEDIVPYYHELTRNFTEDGILLSPPIPDPSEIWYGMNKVEEVKNNIHL